jgi:phosphatidylinositol alpha-1,6-mannosyltransferase
MTRARVRRTLRILTIGHSYVVARNRELAHALAHAAGDDCEVTVAAPLRFPGDLGPLVLHEGREHGVHVRGVPVHLARRIHLMRYGHQLRALLQEDFDIVHAWEEPYIVAGAQIARWTPPSAALVFATFQNIRKHYPPPFSLFERRALARADGWIAFGSTVEEALAARAPYEARPHEVIPLGVDLHAFRPDAQRGAQVRERLGWSADGGVVFGYLGRFVAEKGVRLLVQRLERLEAPWRALFVGGGALDAELRAWAAQRPAQVRIVNGVKHADVPQYLNAMDVLCAPSITTHRWKEQLGRMLIEACAAGVPCIASDSGEIPHVLGEAGLVVEEASEQAWHTALMRLAQDDALRAHLGSAARARAESHFAWDGIARRHLAFFRALLEARA